MKRFVLLILLTQCSIVAFSQTGGGCSNAIEVSSGNSYVVDSMIIGAATYQNEIPFPSKAKWYKIKPANDGLLTISTCNGGADTRMFVYTGTCDTLIPFGFNDDYCAMNASNVAYAATVSKPVKAGKTYYIEFDNAWDTARFSFSVLLSAYSPRTSQTCQTAFAITPGTMKVDSLIGYATRGDAGFANWYKFTPTRNGKLSINSCGSVTDTRLFIYDNCNATRPIAESDNDCSGNDLDFAASITDLAVTAGKTYYFEWDDGNETAPFEFTLVFDAITPTEDLALSRNIKVMPNPAADNLTVYYYFESPTDVQLQLVNTVGQVVLTQKNAGQLRGADILDVSHLQNGMYFLQIRDGERFATKKIIVRH